MKKLTVDSIIIVDTKNKCANMYSFGEQSNLITSTNNTIGKSSLIKSIYYSLGASIASFPDGWSYKDYVFQLSCHVDNRVFIIKRQNKIFSVLCNGEIKQFNKEVLFSEHIQKILGIKFELPEKKSESLHTAYMNALLIPFYVDQDNSWGNTCFYKKAIKNVEMYKGQPKVIFENYLGLKSSRLRELEANKTEHVDKKNMINSQIDQISNVYDAYYREKDLDPTFFRQFDLLKSKIDEYVLITNKIENKMSKLSEKITQSKTKINSFRSEISELKKLIKLTKERQRNIEFECSYCHSILTKEQSLSRLELSDNLTEVTKKITKFSSLLSQEKESLNADLKSFNALENDYKQRNADINSSKELKDIDDYVNQKVLAELDSLRGEYYSRKEKIEFQLKEIEKDIRDEKKLINNRKDEIELFFDTLKNKISIELNIDTIGDRNFLDFKTLAGSGVSVNKSLLALYLIYSEIQYEYSEILFPFAIDSFIKNETSELNINEMFSSVNNHFISLKTQTFFSVLEENLSHFDNTNSKILKLTSPLLKKDKYDSLVSDLLEDK
ncbi:MAG: hypothetical protein LBM13_04430 [Candidatus Ancillula sp.]|jgi:hypothetical protein|nr:hypothetical protein [Candidatus Ancillula sp.]